MTEVGTPINDWNAADADRHAKKPSLLGRIALASHRSMTNRALREAGARKVSGDEQPRLHNIASGLAERLRLGPVDLYVIDKGGPNALAGRTDRPVVAVTSSLLTTFARTELEAVVAHCLVRHRSAGRKGVPIGYSDDVRAVALTRYPPALIAAIRKAEPYTGRSAPFYLVGEGPTHRPVEERIEELDML
jgi:hypothetical protein